MILGPKSWSQVSNGLSVATIVDTPCHHQSVDINIAHIYNYHIFMYYAYYIVQWKIT